MGEGVWAISYWELALRVVFAMVAGGLVGLEREWSNHAAGFRTHILVCLGSTSIMLLSIYGFSAFADEANVRMDPARLAAQVISGIGFLGAGAIMRNGFTISGLTTAASLWVVAAIGLCVGAGFYFVSFLTTFVVLFSLFLLNRWEKRFFSLKRKRRLELKITCRAGQANKIVRLVEEEGAIVTDISIDKKETISSDNNQLSPVQIKFVLRITNEAMLISLADHLATHPDILSFRQVVSHST
ncbi:MgtC/SapB family protein [Cohnella terricola]|uniref:MgtC/SapB family protein n=1 Tax=Cohnella terricola TaxID=1289167 RepID=A0A559JJC4_9BACL|nr:MgtC/SapB family protein [Cohnella terricola]TVX99974.1 MgtC/SapB family protein [Cohnella terricola]